MGGMLGIVVRGLGSVVIVIWSGVRWLDGSQLDPTGQSGNTGMSCFVRRILAHEISIFDLAHMTLLTPAQDWLRICSGLLTLRTIAERAQNWSYT
jgi:hypothetical protein